MRIVVCKVCRHDTFKMVVPDQISGTVNTTTECVRCGEEAKNFSFKWDTIRLTPKIGAST